MDTFREWLNEVLKIDNNRVIGSFSNHPLMKSATFGVEIEFAVGTEQDMEQRTTPDVTSTQLDLSKLITNADYKWTLGDANATAFGIGTDGTDHLYELPIIEIRTNPLSATKEEFHKFENFLYMLKNYVQKNKETHHFFPSTGIHVHVSNPNIGLDIFSKLSAIVGPDEDGIWDDLAHTDRDFNRSSRFSNMENYESRQKGVAQEIVKLFSNVKNKTYTNQQFANILMPMGKNLAVNFNSRHPTVEYRYLPSTILDEHNGVERVMNYIRYFLAHSVSRTNKNQIKLTRDIDSRTRKTVVFTRQVNNKIHVDTQDKTRQTGYPNAELRKFQPAKTPLNQT